MKWDEPVIITGCTRSGTTALQIVLSAIGGGCVWHEFALYHPNADVAKVVQGMGRSIAGKYGDCGPLTWHDIQEMNEPLMYSNPLIDHVRLRDAVEHIHASWGEDEVRDELFTQAEQHKGPLRIYGDKTPVAYARDLKATLEKWPKAKVLFTVRDGRDVACSQARLTGGQPNRLTGHWVEVMRQLAEDLHDPYIAKRVCLVNFEGMAKDPVKGFRGLARWLGIEWDSADDRVVRFMHQPKNIGRWREACPNIEDITGKDFPATLRAWGY